MARAAGIPAAAATKCANRCPLLGPVRVAFAAIALGCRCFIRLTLRANCRNLMVGLFICLFIYWGGVEVHRVLATDGRKGIGHKRMHCQVSQVHLCTEHIDGLPERHARLVDVATASAGMLSAMWRCMASRTCCALAAALSYGMAVAPSCPAKYECHPQQCKAASRAQDDPESPGISPGDGGG